MLIKSDFGKKNIYIYIYIKKKSPPKRDVGVEEVTSSRPQETRTGVKNMYMYYLHLSLVID